MNRLLAFLASFAALSSHAEFRYSDTHLQLFVAGAAWSITLPREDWRVVQEQRNSEATAVYYYVAGDRGTQFSVYMDRTTQCSSPDSCRRLWLAKPHPSMQGAKTLQEGERNGFSFIAYHGNARMGERMVALTNVSAHAYRDGHWIDFRASTTGAGAPDPAPLLALLDKLTFDAPTASAGPKRYPAGPRMVELDVPVEWREEPAPGRTQTVRFTHSGKDFMVVASFMVPPDGKPAPGAPDRTQANVRRAADAALGRAVEKSIDVVSLKGAAARGYYFKATDRAPEKDGYRHIVQGEARAQEVAILFTILSNDGQDASVQRALEMIRGMRVR